MDVRDGFFDSLDAGVSVDKATADALAAVVDGSEAEDDQAAHFVLRIVP
jgi:hypothetical protein